MSGIPCLARVMTAALLLSLAAPGLAQLWSPLDTKPRPASPARAAPRLSVLCLPPGGSGSGVPCGTATRETILIVRTERSVPAPPRLLVFKQIGGDTQRVVRVPLTPQPYISSGTHHIKVPPQLCARKGISRWQVQIATNDFSQPETSQVHDADSVGYFQMRCN